MMGDMIWLWIGFNVFVLGMLALDLGVFHRHSHTVSMKEAVTWSVVWISLALLFNLGIYLFWHQIVPSSAYSNSYAAYTKGSTALLAASIATADFWNVRDALAQQWDQERAGQAEQNFDRVRKVTAKAWRFVGEMEEIAATFRSAGVPGEFHDAAATVYQRMAEFKDAAATPNLDDVLQSLLDHERDK